MVVRVRSGVVLLAAAAVALAAATAAAAVVVPKAQLTRAEYSEWVHSQWIWLYTGTSTQDEHIAYLTEYNARDLPVGVVNIDAGWATHFNSFIWNTVRYPNASALVDAVHAQGARITFWLTSIINTDSENYAEAFENNYFLNDGKTVNWWLGVGSLLDYTNPYALQWWNSQMDRILDLGIDGWKLDGTDPFIWFLKERAYGYAGRVRKATYSELFYRTIHDHTRLRNPESASLTRPMDGANPGMKRIPRLFFTPQDICFAGWVGDQDPDYYGLQAALLNIFASANFNYVNVGSDIGGFRSDSSPLGRTKDSFIRWTQASALNPLFENGGQKEHRPWIFDEETYEIYRTYLWLHEELRPFYYSRGNDAFDQEIAILEHQGKCFWKRGEPLPFPDPCPYEWTLARDIFTSPMVTNTTNIKTVTFPYPGEQWVDWWDDSRVYNATDVVAIDAPLAYLPLYRRVGSVVPLHVARRYTGDDFGMPLERMMEATGRALRTAPELKRTSKVAEPVLAPAPVRVLVWTHPLLVDVATAARDVVHSTVRDDYGPGLTVDARFAAAVAPTEQQRTLRLALSAHPRPTAIVVTGWTAPAAATRVAMVGGTFSDGRAAVADADASAHTTIAVRSVAGLHDLGAVTAFAVDEVHARLIVWIDGPTAEAGAVLELVAEASSAAL